MSSRLRVIWSRLRALIRRDRLDRDFDDELAVHLELLTDDARRRGLPDADARREALLKLGLRVVLREQHRDARGLPLIDAIAQDSKYAVRALWKSPAFTAVVTLTLALGIGALTAVFSVFNAVMLRELPVAQPDALREIDWSSPRPGFATSTTSDGKQTASGDDLIEYLAYPAYAHVRDRATSFSHLFCFAESEVNLVTPSGATKAIVNLVSGNYFRGLGVGASQGRPLTEDDDQVNDP
jgi:hypothetical protein